MCDVLLGVPGIEMCDSGGVKIVKNLRDVLYGRPLMFVGWARGTYSM